MHHLKTMAETYIYFFVVLKDDSAKMARLVLADACMRKATFHREHRTLSSHASFWERFAKEVRGPLTDELPSLEQLARDHGGSALKTWYSEVYRFACEPAHIGDLFEYMPDPDTGELPARPDFLSTYRAESALHYACGIAIDILRAFVEYSKQPLSVPVDDLAERLQIVSGLRRTLPSWTCSECAARLEGETVAVLNRDVGQHLATHAVRDVLGGAEQ